jgi:CHAT domain-containing protein
MQRAPFQLSLTLVIAFCFQPFNHAQNNSPETETALRSVVDELFVAYAREDVDGYMKLWSAKSPDLASRRKAVQDLFAANEKIEVKSLMISKVKEENEKASVRVAIEMTALDAKTTRPATGFGKTNRVLDFVKEDGRWLVWREAAAEEDLAAALVAAKNDHEREVLMEANRDLITPHLSRALRDQGTKLRLQGKYAEALAVYATAQKLSEQIGDKGGIVQSLIRTGEIHYRQGNYDLSMASLQKCFALADSLGDQVAVAEIFNHFAIVHYLRGNFDLALEYYQKALALGESLKSKGAIATALTGLGNIHYRRGNYELTLDYYRKALALREAIGNKSGLSYALNNVAVVNHVLGNYGLALDYYRRSLALSEMVNEIPEIPRVLANIATLHHLQRNQDLALEYYQRSLKMTEKLNDKLSLTYILRQIGHIYRAQGGLTQAMEYYQKSLKLAEDLKDKHKIAVSLTSIGNAYHDQGNYNQALEYYQKSLELGKELGLKAEIADTLSDIGSLHYSQGQYSKAIELLEAAADLCRQTNRGQTLWYIRTEAGAAYLALNQPGLARQAFEEAIDTVESLRSHVAGGEQEQLRYFENKVAPYHRMVETLVAEDQNAEALNYAERAKARVLLDVLRSGRRDVAKAMTAREIEQELASRAELVSLNSQLSRETGRAQPDPVQLDALKARLQKARLEYEAFQTNLYAAHPELRVQRAEAKTLTLQDAGGLLTEDQDALLEYVVTDKKTYLFVLTAASAATQDAPHLKSYTLPISRNDLAEHVKAFRQQLARRDLTFRATASKLYDLLISPVSADLQGKRTLVIVPDGVLWELPFQALTNANGKYLIEDHPIAYAPSLTVLREMTKLRKQRQSVNRDMSLLAIGNPELRNETSERVKLVHRDERLEPLPDAETEVKTLGQLYGARSTIYIGAEAREDRFKKEASRFKVLHLATHGILNDASPMYSQILLAQSDESEDGLLEAWEIMKLDLNADLVVLSACESGRGRVGAGEGVIGLTWALFVAGSPTSVVSQWKVESSSTSQLMVEFHRNLQPTTQKPRLSKAKALQRAALKMLGTRNFRHPFYWGGFILVGDGS